MNSYFNFISCFLCNRKLKKGIKFEWVVLFHTITIIETNGKIFYEIIINTLQCKTIMIKVLNKYYTILDIGGMCQIFLYNLLFFKLVIESTRANLIAIMLQINGSYFSFCI